MPTLEDELRRYGDLLDATATTAEPGHDVAVTEAAPPRRAARGALVAAGVVAIAVVVAIVVGTRSTHEVPPATASSATTTTAPATLLPVSIQRTFLGTTASRSIAGVVTDSRRWHDLWQGHTAPAVDFAHDDAFVVDAFCPGQPTARLRGDVLNLTWPNLSTISCASDASFRYTITVPRDRLPSVITFVPGTSETSLRVALRPGAFAFVGTQPPAPEPLDCVIHANRTGGPATIITIRLPDAQIYGIGTGDPITNPQAVTIDGDGSTDIGASPNDAASLLWGPATDGGPFAGLDGVAIGSTIELRQSSPTTTACEQHWRVAAIASDDAIVAVDPGTTGRPALTLVGFRPSPESAGPDALFDVVTVPGS